MDADIKAGKVDTVIVRGIDRIARNIVLAERWISGLKTKGVKLIAADGSLNRPIMPIDILHKAMRDVRRCKN